MILFISQIKEILEELAEVGIFIESINSTLDFEAKYVKVTKEIEALPPLDFILYEEILAKHQTNVKCLEEQAKHHSQIEKK